MKAMILAAGEGRRLRPLTELVPKPLLPVGGRPLIVRLIELLAAHGVREIAINVHHRPAAMIAALGDGARFGVRIVYSPEPALLGSAGGVKRMARFFGAEPFLVLCGDVLTDLNLSAMRAFHAERGAAATIAVHQPERLHECGVVRLAADARITEFVEKPAPGQEPSSWANAGVYVLEPQVLRFVPDGLSFDFGRDLFPLLLQRGVPIFAYASAALVLDIGTPEQYRQAQTALARPAGRPWAA